MARKNLLRGLMEGEAKEAPAPTVPAPEARVDTARPRYSKGAIGAVSQSIAELKSRTVSEIDPALIDDGGYRDRLEGSDSDLDGLIESIREYGQQVPVLLRPNPDDAERYQTVYGRRRVAALKAIGLPVKAMVRALDDRALVIAQGQENSARRDLSFIEKANFARQMRDAGYDRKVICDALHMDKTLISRMLSVADRIPVDLIEAIGSAPGIGRDRWLSLADRIKGRNLVKEAKGSGSDERFEAVMASLAAPRKPAPKPDVVRIKGGTELATVARKGTKTQVTFNRKTADGFDEWLVENLAEIHRDWSTRRGG